MICIELTQTAPGFSPTNRGHQMTPGHQMLHCFSHACWGFPRESCTTSETEPERVHCLDWLYKHFCVSVNGIRDYPQNQKNLFFQTDIIYTSYTTAIVSFDTFLQFYKHLPFGSYAHPGQIPLSQQKTSGHQTNVKYKLKILENTALLIAKFSRLRFPAVSPSFNTTHWLLWTLYINTALIQEIIGK